MTTTIDTQGRIELGREVRERLGVQPGDDVVLEERGDEWVIKAAAKTGLCWVGNVLVHRGISLEPIEVTLEKMQQERMDQLWEGVPQ